MAEASLGSGTLQDLVTLLTGAARFHFQHLRWSKLAETAPTYLIDGEEHPLSSIHPTTSFGFQLHHTCCFGLKSSNQQDSLPFYRDQHHWATLQSFCSPVSAWMVLGWVGQNKYALINVIILSFAANGTCCSFALTLPSFVEPSALPAAIPGFLWEREQTFQLEQLKFAGGSLGVWYS